MPDELDRVNLEQLVDKLPPEWQAIVRQYGPALISMTAAEVLAWINLLAMGDHEPAYRILLSRLPNDGLLAKWDEVGARWESANNRNVAALALQREAMAVVLNVMLKAALALVGL